jgi:hypothetical protein
MDPSTGGGLAALLDFLSRSGRDVWRAVMFVFLVSAVALLLLAEFGVANKIVDTYRDWLIVLIVVAVAFFAWDIGRWLFRNDDGVPWSRKHLDQAFKTLAQDEVAALRQFVGRNERTVKLPASLPGLQSLVERGWVTCNDGPILGSSLDGSFTLALAVWEYLHEEKQRGH